MTYPFRVFVSYAHADRDLVEGVVSRLSSMGLHPLWDKDIIPGKSFTQEIKDLITRAHLFIPVITPHSNQRPWVHQETGFAIALNIPVLPICIGETPSEMIAEVQAVTVKGDLSDLVEQLCTIDLMRLVIPKPEKPPGLMVVAETTDQRTQYIVQYSNWVLDLGAYGFVRLEARFTSFSIPNENPLAPIWDQREGDAKRSPYSRQLEREERQILERHARMAGCRLIIDPSASTHESQGTLAREVRLNVLRDFIQSMPKDKIEVAISPVARDVNLMIVGDYFSVEAIASRPSGYVHTVVNAHPPTVLQRIQQYDRLFEEIQGQNPMSLDEVIRHL